MPRFTTSSTTYGAFYARPQAPSAGVKKPTVAIDNPYANSLVGIDVYREDDRGTRALIKFVEPVAEDVEQLVQALFFARWCNKDATLTALGSAKALADPDAVEAALDTMAPWCNHTAYPVGAVHFEGEEWARRSAGRRGGP